MIETISTGEEWEVSASPKDRKSRRYSRKKEVDRANACGGHPRQERNRSELVNGAATQQKRARGQKSYW